MIQFFIHSPSCFVFLCWLTGGKHPCTLYWSIMIATSDTVQSEPHSHTEYVNFEPSQHTEINKLEDFHIVRAVKNDGLKNQINK